MSYSMQALDALIRWRNGPPLPPPNATGRCASLKNGCINLMRGSARCARILGTEVALPVITVAATIEILASAIWLAVQASLWAGARCCQCCLGSERVEKRVKAVLDSIVWMTASCMAFGYSLGDHYGNLRNVAENI